MSATCNWSEEGDGGIWVSDCGRMFSFDDENDFNFCPYCGGEMDKGTRLTKEDIEAEKADRKHQEMKDMGLL